MTLTQLVECERLAAVLGGVAFWLVGLLVLLSPSTHWSAVLILVGAVLLMVGLVGFHTLQGDAYELIGHAGLYLSLAVPSVVLFGWPVFAVQRWTVAVWQSGAASTLLVGCGLYGVATWCAGVFPRWCGALFAVGPAVAIALPGAREPALFGLVWMALGYTLWACSEAREPL